MKEALKKLRTLTGAPIMECKHALKEADGNIEEAIRVLRTRGLAEAKRKEGRPTNEGVIAAYIHQNKKIGVLLELNCETDFVARTKEFQELANNLCLQIAAYNPLYISKECVDEERLKRERQIFIEQAKNMRKPPHLWERIAEGRLKKFFTEVCLLQQPYVKDESISVQDYIAEVSMKVGENIKVARFVRYRLGESEDKV